MSFSEGITINNKHSYENFGLVINAREIGIPEKRSVRKSVPFFNGFYDFSALNGSPTWGERTIKYTFDIIGATVAEMDEERMDVLAWLCNVHDVDIFDDTIPNYHFHGSYGSYSMTEDGEHVQLTVVFVCQPFMFSNTSVVSTVYGSGTINIVNNGQPSSFVISTSQVCTVTIGNIRKSVPPVNNYKMGVLLDSGKNVVTVEKVNEIKYPYVNTTTTNNGITFTDNGDGTITANGTATEVAWFWLWGSGAKFKPPVGKHRVVGCPANVGSNNYRIQYYVYNGSEADSKYYYDFGSGATIDVTDKTEYISMAIRVVNGYTANNVVFNPQMHGETKITFTQEVF